MDWELISRYFNLGPSRLPELLKSLALALVSCAIIAYLLISNGLVVAPVNEKMETEIYFDSNITASKQPLDIENLEKLVHTHVNAERVANGLPLLQFDEKLADIARDHSKDMGVHNYFEHNSPEGETPIQRGNNAGYPCRKDYSDKYTLGISENIAYDWLWSRIRQAGGIEYQRDWYKPDALAGKLVDRWMNSPPHRENILGKEFDREGIGIYVTDDGKVMATEDFC